MKKLSNKDYKLLEQICKLREVTLWKTMYEYLIMQYPKVKKTTDYIYAEGDIPIVLIAHLDTVFSEPPTNVYYDERKGVLWSPDGLGADDRAGVFVILKIIGQGYKPHIIFTLGEERGGIGAIQLALTEQKCPFKDVRYMIQLDRRGKTDCVFYDCNNFEFTNYIESFGFIEEIGSFSDVSILSPAWKIAGVNLSVGYENEHSISETLHVNSMFSTIEKVIEMCKKAKEAPYFKFIPNQWYAKYYGTSGKLGFGSNYDLLTGYEDYYDYASGYPIESYLTDTIICDHCKKTFTEYEMFPVELKDYGIKYLCPDCISEHNVDWCNACGQPYVPSDKSNTHLCYTCKAELRSKNKEKNGKSKSNSKRSS